jgi:UDP-N-acetylmuramate--alanine ligase
MIDDYAHHPTELRMAIDAARNLYPGKKLTGVFQPHLFSRTQDFYKEFAEVLDELDECILIPVYPARELSIKGISSKTIFDELKIQNKYLVDKNKVLDHIKSSEIEVLIVLGAGDIDALPAKLKELMKK